MAYIDYFYKKHDGFIHHNNFLATEDIATIFQEHANRYILEFISFLSFFDGQRVNIAQFASFIQSSEAFWMFLGVGERH